MPPAPKKKSPPPPRVVVDIRGTHGSGKTHVMRTLLGMTPWESYVGPGRASKKGPVKDRHLGFTSDEWNAAIVGNYDPAKTSGGCDIIQDPEEVVRRVVHFSTARRLVFLEGILVAHTFQRYNDLAVELEGVGGGPFDEPTGLEYRFYFLDTPLDLCLERVRARNASSEAGNVRPFREDNVRKDHHNIWDLVRAKCLRAGRNVRILDYRRPVEQLVEELGLPCNR
jgi:hypothetical protein